MGKVRIGFVGFGLMGELYADAIYEFPNSIVAAVTDRNSARREKAEKKYKCKTFDSYYTMYKETQLDAVIVAMPDHLHRDPVIEAAKCGINILVEKPFALSVHDAESMVEAIEKAGVKCMVEFFNRWSVPFANARELVMQQKLGQILSVSIDLNDTIYVPTEMLSWAAESSSAWFLMSHTADLVTWITGKKPKSVFSRGTKKLLVSKGIDTYDVIEALVEFSDGTIGRYTNGWILPKAFPLVYELKMRLIGSEAAIDINTSDQQMHFITHSRYEHTNNSWGKIQGNFVGHSFEMLRSFLKSIEDGTPPLITERDGLENTRFVEAVHVSLKRGQPVLIEG